MSNIVKLDVDIEALKQRVLNRIDRREARIARAAETVRIAAMAFACLMGFAFGTLQNGAAEGNVNGETTAAVADGGINLQEINYDGSFV